MDALEKKYFDLSRPGALAGEDKFFRSKPGQKRGRIKNFLSSEPAYTRHRPVRRRFRRRRVVVSGINAMWDIDLLFMLKERDENDGYLYIVVCVDVLSKKLRVDKLKSKSTREVTDSLRKILNEASRTKDVPSTLRSDMGSEFRSALFSKMVADFGINHFFTFNTSIKANLAERVIQTLKVRLSRYFTKERSRRWVDILQDVVKSYNSTFHRSIGMSPNDVTRGEREEEVWRRLYQSVPSGKGDGPFLYDVGDTVRISHLTKAFTRAYDARWTNEVFKVVSRVKIEGFNTYSIEDLNSDPVRGTFYQKELQKVSIDLQGVFHIESVLRSRRRRGAKEFLVRWEGWPASFDSWIRESDFQ